MNDVRESFAGRVALVTGSQGAIGSAIVRLLAEAGARVVCADQRGDIAPDAAGTAGDACIALDVRDASQVRALFQSIDLRAHRWTRW